MLQHYSTQITNAVCNVVVHANWLEATSNDDDHGTYVFTVWGFPEVTFTLLVDRFLSDDYFPKGFHRIQLYRSDRDASLISTDFPGRDNLSLERGLASVAAFLDQFRFEGA